jgi:aryl-alcohol dehydrogenase-like predicted oxidoreductase
MRTLTSRLALGTVQFGLPYGIANKCGQVSEAETRAILEHARAAGIVMLDTAIAYGESERRLGEFGVEDWHVVSKLPPIPAGAEVRAWVGTSVRGSLARLKLPKLHALLLHRSEELRGIKGDLLYSALIDVKHNGLVDKIGVSIYNPCELDALMPRFSLDIVQAPFNVLDQRIATSGWLRRLYGQGIDVHVRSVFLQGLLLMTRERRPERFRKWESIWDAWHAWLDEQRLTPLQACLGFALAQSEIAQIVVGVDSKAQLQEVLANNAPIDVAPPSTVISTHPDLINPSSWISS